MNLTTSKKLFAIIFLSLTSTSFWGQQSDSLAVAQHLDSLIQVSRRLTKENYFAEAKAIHDTAEHLALERFGPRSLVYGSICFNSGRISQFQGNHPEAMKGYLEAKSVFESTSGTHHPDYSNVLRNMGVSCFYARQDSLAEVYYLEWLAHQEKNKEPVAADYALNLEYLGQLYYYTYRFDQSEYYRLRSKSVREKSFGAESHEYTKSLISLGYLYLAMGRYDDAEACCLSCMSVYEKNNLEEHPYYGESLSLLGTVYDRLGNYERAAFYYMAYKSFIERTVPLDAKEYAKSVKDLGLAFLEMRKYDAAERYLLEAKSIMLDGQLSHHPDYAKVLNNLGLLYQRLGQYDKAISMIRESIDLEARTNGKEHTDYARALANLGAIYADMMQYDSAEYFLLTGKSIYEKRFGEAHPHHIKVGHILGHLYSATGRYGEAEPLIVATVQQTHKRLRDAVQFLSEKNLGNYLLQENRRLESLPSYLRTGQFSNRMAMLVYDDALFQKGFLQTVARRLNTLAVATPEADSLSKLLKSYRATLSEEYTTSGSSRQKIVDLEEKADATERQLARTVAGYAEALKQVKWQEVQAALKPDEAAVEFLRFTVQLPNKSDSVRYAALLLRPGDPAPIYVDLCEEQELGILVVQNTTRKSEYVERLYQLNGRGLVPGSREKSRSLYELVWQPLERHLQGVQTLYYANAGLLHRINLGAVSVNLDSVLADRYTLVTLGSTRSLVMPDLYSTTNDHALVMGGIQYDSDTTALFSALFSLDTISYATRSAVRFYRADTGPTVSWLHLPYALREADNISKTLKKSNIASLVLKGYDATEEAFYKSVRLHGSSPRVIHLATHGYFFADPTESGAGDGESVFKRTEHPLIRSGLILAGGNHAWATGAPIKPGLEDGILTAYEISQLNLSGTELVVLSACETGLGDIQGNEGVYGLQRAFKIAGARYLIMSLWEVPDGASELFMRHFYMLWLEQGMSIPDAFRQTQAYMRRSGLPQSQYAWAGFVLLE